PRRTLMSSRIFVSILLLLSVSATAQNPGPSKKPRTSGQSTKPAAEPKPAADAKSSKPERVEDMMGSFQAMEKSYWEAWKNKDAKPFEQQMAPNALIIDNTGVTDKTDVLKGIAGCEVKGYKLGAF